MAMMLLRDVRLVPLAARRSGRWGGAVPPAPVPAEPVDVLVRDGLVVDVGPGLRPGVLAPTIDAAGRWLVPGLWDQHVHLGQWTVTAARLDLSGARSAEEAVRMVAERIADGPEGAVIGWGHRSAHWPDEPLVPLLDAVAPHTPVILISGDAHHAWMNTTALMWLALPVREAVVREAEWFRAYGRLMTMFGDDSTSPAAYRRTMEAAAERGVVGLVDFEFGGGFGDWTDRYDGGADLLRVRAATYADGLEDAIGAGLRTGDPLEGCDGMVTMGPLKIISDGSLNTRTAWCCAPYADAHRLEYPAGQPNLDYGELRALLARADGHGLEVATHAIGDAAVEAALRAYAETGAAGAIEHAQLVARADVRRMAELGLRASVQPAHLLDDRDLTERVWPDRTEGCFAWRWFADAGVDLRFGSDAPVAPLDPWLAMAAAVHRSADDRPVWHPEHTLTPAEALAASVDGLGTVAPGHPADLVLLDTDPLALGPAEGAPMVDEGGEVTWDTAAAAAALRDMPVALTMVGGRVVHPV
ncbi:amidohydrolase [Nocardioides sp. CFH 31398]|uniref:amidohydrolase n=1 Tax=Nocardioides sp. CFH 31398 TaxID=2919579 RepID=UPI001F06207C|nr:amidohydrolase family protein [Nocardioides sp. CFH 31398]MCH1864932.1 amidohydrolase family protein [Nocardioides sp. CFH 31398]